MHDLRALPHAEEAEKSLLSLCLQEPADYIPSLIEAGITPQHFYVPAHGVVWKLLEELHADESPIEMVSFSQHLRDRNHLKNIGGSSALAGIYAAAPTGMHFDHHLEILLDRYARRETILWSQKVSRAAYDCTENYKSLLTEPVERILESGYSPKDCGGAEAVADWIESWKGKYLHEEEHDRMECGVEAIDDLRGGLDSPGLTYIGAFPSTGKTAFMVQVMCHRLKILEEQGLDRTILIFSAEMTRRQIITRAMIHLCQFDDPRKITAPSQGQLTKGELRTIKEKMRLLSTDKLQIREGSGLRVEEFEARADIEGRKRPFDFIAVDYLQRMRAEGGNIEQVMLAVTGTMQRVQKRHSCGVIGLSQLTKDSSGRIKLKYAEALEEDADLYIRIDREREEDEVKGFFIGKDRHAGTRNTFLPVTFDKYRQVFRRR